MARAMKDSGIPWIGEIPEGWKVGKAKYYVTIENGTDPKTEGDIPVYGSGSDSFKTCGEYKEGPCVLIGRKGATLHIPHYIEGRYWNVDTAFDVKTKGFYDLRLYYYAACCFDYKLYISQTTLPGMTQTSYENMFLPLTSSDEQAKIVSFLDTECARIDAVIEKTRASIEEYKKLKQAVITEAVTKGIRPGRKMKDSGIAWIGEIPEEWEIHKLCWDYEAMLGKMLDTKRVTGHHLRYYIKNSDVQWWHINITDLDEMDFAEDEKERYTIRSGDLIVCEGGEIGKCAVVPETIPNDIYYQKALHRIRSHTSKNSNVSFLGYVLFAMAKMNAFDTTYEKATIQHLPGDAISQLRIPTPPSCEQNEIVECLDRKRNEIDAVIELNQKRLNEIENYKKSTIYEFVTGKREVQI